MIETLTCKAGHTWKRTQTRGRKPEWCPKHNPIVTGTHTPSPPKMSQEEKLAKAREAKKQKQAQREEEGKGRLGRVIDEELSRPAAKHCRCGLHNKMTLAEVMGMGSGCTAGRWVCPILDAVRRRMGR